MALNKKLSFASTEIILADFAKALSHPARIAIIKTLAEKQTCICGEIVEVIPLAQATVSQHLKELKNAGLIRGEIDGAKSCYCINWDALNEYTALFHAFLESIKTFKQNQSCC